MSVRKESRIFGDNFLNISVSFREILPLIQVSQKLSTSQQKNKSGICVCEKKKNRGGEEKMKKMKGQLDSLAYFQDSKHNDDSIS